MNEQQLQKLHKRSFLNRKRLEVAGECSCFYCLRTFPVNKIEEWVDSDTALCPFCGIDSIIDSIDSEVLTELHEWCFHAEGPNHDQ